MECVLVPLSVFMSSAHTTLLDSGMIVGVLGSGHQLVPKAPRFDARLIGKPFWDRALADDGRSRCLLRPRTIEPGLPGPPRSLAQIRGLLPPQALENVRDAPWLDQVQAIVGRLVRCPSSPSRGVARAEQGRAGRSAVSLQTIIVGFVSICERCFQRFAPEQRGDIQHASQTNTTQLPRNKEAAKAVR